MLSSSAPGSQPTYSFGALLGSGTFGEVYLARMRTPSGIEQDVAVKLLNPGLHPKSQPVSRMRDEGHMLASLNHPAILAVKDLCLLEGRIGLVTEYLPGADLHDAIFDEQDPIPPRALLAVIGALADALHTAFHSTTLSGSPMGLVHRDIKPANVRLTPHGAVKLLDFGIAKSEDERRETATTERVAIGTPAYMAPEVQTYEVLDALPSRDVFALGCTLYEGLAHELFFEGMDAKSIVRLCNQRERFDAHLLARLPKIGGQDRRVVTLITRMLRYDHTQRPTAREVADTCAGLVEELGGPTLRTWCQAHRWPEPGAKKGPWSGRRLEDQGAVASGAHPAPGGRSEGAGASATMAPFLDVAAGVHATLVPSAGQAPQQTIVHIAGANGAAAQVHTVGTTQVVVVPTQTTAAPTRRKGIDFENWIMGGLGIVVLALAFLMLQNPDAFSALLKGDVQGAIAAVQGGVSSWGGLPDGAMLAGGREWGASGTDPEDVLGEVAVEGDADVILARPGKPVLSMPSEGSVIVPPGPVEVSARFGKGGSHEHQLSIEVGPGELVRVVCDARAASCVRR